MGLIGTVAPWRFERYGCFHRLFTHPSAHHGHQDRYAGLSGAGGFRGGGFRGGPRGLGGRGMRGGGFRGGFRGGFAAQAGAGRDFSNQDLYADYSGPDQQAAPGGLRMDGYGTGGFAGAGAIGFNGPGAAYTEPEPSQQIMVRNVRGKLSHPSPAAYLDDLVQLPWSTANEDLVELFETTGQVELAEILFDGTRSKGCGVVQFAQIAEAETAIGMSRSLCTFCNRSPFSSIAKFQQYMYGGRPLGEFTLPFLLLCLLRIYEQMYGLTTVGTLSRRLPPKVVRLQLFRWMPHKSRVLKFLPLAIFSVIIF